jgi:hypothetical protein
MTAVTAATAAADGVLLLQGHQKGKVAVATSTTADCCKKVGPGKKETADRY